MRKKRSALLTLGVVALLVATAMPVQAGQPQDGGGLWQYTPTVVGERQAGCNLILTTTEAAIWTGTFEGESTEAGRVIFHCSGSASFKATVTFDEVTVDGKTGSLEMSVTGRFPAGGTEWDGRGTILSGTGDLENLRGQIKWWGPGAPGPGEQGDIYYSSKIHFEPN